MRNQIDWSAPSRPDPSRSNEKWLIDTVNADPTLGNRWLGNQLGASKAAVNIRICSLRKAGIITVRREPGVHGQQALQEARQAQESGDPVAAPAPAPVSAPVSAKAQAQAVEEPSDERLIKQVLGALKQRGGPEVTIGRLADRFDVPPKRIRAAVESLNQRAYMTRTVQDVIYLANEPVGNSWSKVNTDVFFDKEIVFGALGDTHLGNRQERLEVLHGIYDIFERQGVRVVYHTGNYVDGECRFNKNELLVHGMGNQIKYFVTNYPQRDGITTHFVAGDDHEGWWVQREGIDIGRYTEMEARAAGRQDLRYLGYMEHDVVIEAAEGRAILRVVHPGGGSAYSISYTAQKLVESYSGGEKPNILLLGHYHKSEYLPGYRNVHSFQTGTVCGQSNFMRKKRLAADIGAWIIRANQAPDGSINRVQAEWIGPWYDREWTAKKWCHKMDAPFPVYEHTPRAA